MGLELWAAGAGLALACCSAHGAERVLDFHSEIRIAQNGTLTVTEMITVQAEGKQIRRGLLREFPVPLEVLSVSRNGRPEPYALERLANGTRLRIGAADVVLPLGPQDYSITYRSARQIGFFKDHDQLSWNVNGTRWIFPFERMSAEVRFADPVPAGDLKVEAYTGPRGAAGRNYQAFVRHGSVAFRITRPLGPREGLTIVVAFPKGVVTPPSRGERFDAWLGDNPAVLAGLAGFLALAVYLSFNWRRVGPRHEPPVGLGPGSVRYLDRRVHDTRGFAAALLDLGARGYLKIREQGGRYELERTEKPPGGREPEQQILRSLFSDGQKQVFFDGQHSATMQAVRERFKQALEQHLGARLFSRRRDAQAIGWLIAAATLGAMFHLEGGLFLLMAFAFPVAALLLLFYGLLPEKEQLAPQTAGEFARLLPYAVALDIEKSWAERFAAILGPAAIAAAVHDYYESTAGEGIGSFTDSLSAMDRTLAAACTPPGSDSGG